MQALAARFFSALGDWFAVNLDNVKTEIDDWRAGDRGADAKGVSPGQQRGNIGLLQPAGHQKLEVFKAAQIKLPAHFLQDPGEIAAPRTWRVQPQRPEHFSHCLR